MSDSLISSGVNVASNEYLTKFSINRNFVKLIDNDTFLSSKVVEDDSNVYSYNPHKSYSAGDLVFFKTALTSQNTYLLSSINDNNSTQPTCITNVNNDIIVIDSKDWKIVGVPALEQLHGKSPTDIADEYVISSKSDFQKSHQDNTDLSAHPLGKFCIQESSVLFSDITNIDSNRSTFFYPYKVQKLHSDNTIIDGYMRKWDNGIIEYDIIFRVGYVGKTDEGYDLLEANNLNLIRRNFNYLYFKDKKDYSAFLKGGDYQALVNNQKQINLNTTLNAYYGQIDFPEEFKDLNYMVFTSNVKNVTTRTYNTKNDVLSGYDYRLSVVGLTIQSHLTSQYIEEEKRLYRQPVDIPLSIENIATGALANVKSDYPFVSFNILSNANIMNIDDRSFRYSEITSISIPYATHHIGQEAFANCSKLKEVTFYVHDDKNLQVKIEQNAFMSTPSLTSINIIYDPKDNSSTLFGANALTDITTEEQRLSTYTSDKSLEEKIRDFDIRTYIYGISPSFDTNNIHVFNKPLEDEQPIVFMDDKYQFFSRDTYEDSTDKEEDISQLSKIKNDDVVDISIQDVFKSIKDSSSQLESQDSMKFKMLFGVSNSEIYIRELSDYFEFRYSTGSNPKPVAITGYKDDMLTGDFEFNTSELLSGNYNKITAFDDYALQNCSTLTSIVLSKKNTKFSEINSVGTGAFYGCNLKNIKIDSYSSDDDKKISAEAFANNGNISTVTLAAASLKTSKRVYIDQTAFANDIIDTLSICTGSRISPGDQNYCLSVNASKLCVDMTDCYFGANFLCGSTINEIHLDKIDKGYNPSGSIKSFGYDAFLGCNANVISAVNGQYMNDVSTFFIKPDSKESGVNPFNILHIENQTLIKATRKNDPDMPQVFNNIVISGDIKEVPEYLIINDQRHILSCDLCVGIDSDISVQYGFTTICANAFNVIETYRILSSLPVEPLEPGEESPNYVIRKIVIPNTVSSIGDYAFANNLSMLDFSIQPNNSFQNIGKGILLSCIDLTSSFEALTSN